MHCKNCGWPNKPGLINCTKCNSPLNGEATPRPSFPEPQDSESPAQQGAETPLNGTVYENVAFADNKPAASHAATVHIPIPNQATPQESSEDKRQCPKCGYPMRPDTDKCPNCKFQVAAPKPQPEKPVSTSKDTEGIVRQPTVGVFQMQNQPQSPTHGTVNSWMQAQPKPKKYQFTLAPIAREEETLEKTLMSYEGESVTLNRANTDTENYSITSKEQAVVTCEDGKWYIEDRSAQHTTFVLARRKMEIQPGDTILLGNRMFVFEDTTK